MRNNNVEFMWETMPPPKDQPVLAIIYSERWVEKSPHVAVIRWCEPWGCFVLFDDRHFGIDKNLVKMWCDIYDILPEKYKKDVDDEQA